MDILMAVLSVVGMIASIVGAVISYRQAEISKRAASLAQRIRAQFIGHRKTSELSGLEARLEAVKRAFVKYASNSPSHLAGVNYSADAEVALEFIHNLKSLREYFSTEDGNAADEVYDVVSGYVERFRFVEGAPERSTVGSDILKVIVGFSPILTKELTAQKESSVD